MAVMSRGFEARRLAETLGPFLTSVRPQSPRFTDIPSTQWQVDVIAEEIAIFTEGRDVIASHGEDFGGFAEAVSSTVDLGDFTDAPGSYYRPSFFGWEPTAWWNLQDSVIAVESELTALRERVERTEWTIEDLFATTPLDTWDVTNCDFGTFAGAVTASLDLGSFAVAPTTRIPDSFIVQTDIYYCDCGGFA